MSWLCEVNIMQGKYGSIRGGAGWQRVTQTGWRSAGCLLSQLCSRSGVYCAVLSNVRDQLIGADQCHVVMITAQWWQHTHTQLLCTMCDDTMTCDYMTIVSRVTVIFTLSWQLVCSIQQRNEFNINIVTVTPDSESRAVGLSPPSL